MKALSLLAVIVATATPALAEFQPERLVGNDVISMADGHGTDRNIDNNRH